MYFELIRLNQMKFANKVGFFRFELRLISRFRRVTEWRYANVGGFRWNRENQFLNQFFYQFLSHLTINFDRFVTNF